MTATFHLESSRSRQIRIQLLRHSRQWEGEGWTKARQRILSAELHGLSCRESLVPGDVRRSLQTRTDRVDDASDCVATMVDKK
jgi:hypothetical protein